MKEKYCLKCKIYKPISIFFEGTKSTGSYCSSCYKEIQLDRFRKDKEKYNLVAKEKRGWAKAYISLVCKEIASQLTRAAKIAARKERMDSIIVLRDSGMTLQQIGERLNLTRERVRQIEYEGRR